MSVVPSSIEYAGAQATVVQSHPVLDYFNQATNQVWRLLKNHEIVEQLAPSLTVNLKDSTNEVLESMLAVDDSEYEYLDIFDIDGVLLPSPFAPIPSSTLDLLSQLHQRPNTHVMAVSSRRDKIGAVCDQITRSLHQTDFVTQIRDLEGDYIPIVTQAERQVLREVKGINGHDRLFELFAHLRNLPFEDINQKKFKLRFTLDIGGLLSFKDFDRFMWFNQLPVEENENGTIQLISSGIE